MDVPETNEVYLFLEKEKLETYWEKFKEEGYDDMNQLIDLSVTDKISDVLSELNITKRGHIRQLTSNISILEKKSISIDTSEDENVLETNEVYRFLKKHSLSSYWQKCKDEGYDNMEALISYAKRNELDDVICDLEITKKGHVQRFKSNIANMKITQSVDNTFSELTVPSKSEDTLSCEPDLACTDNEPATFTYKSTMDLEGSNESSACANTLMEAHKDLTCANKLMEAHKDLTDSSRSTKNSSVVVQDSAEHDGLEDQISDQISNVRLKQAIKYKEIKEKNMISDTIVEYKNKTTSKYPNGYGTINDIRTDEGCCSNEVIQSANSPVSVLSKTVQNMETPSQISGRRLGELPEECSQEGPTLEDLQYKHICQLQSYLDPITLQRNWFDLGKVVFHGNPAMQEKVDGLNYAGGGSPSRAFMEYFGGKFNDYTVKQFSDIAKELHRNDIVNVLREVKGDMKFKDISYLLGIRICGMLEKRAPGVSNWRQFAWRVGCGGDVINEFQNAVRSKDVYSPTEALLNLIKANKPGYKLYKLSECLSKLERNDVMQYIDNVIKQLTSC